MLPARHFSCKNGSCRRSLKKRPPEAAVVATINELVKFWICQAWLPSRFSPGASCLQRAAGSSRSVGNAFSSEEMLCSQCGRRGSLPALAQSYPGHDGDYPKECGEYTNVTKDCQTKSPVSLPRRFGQIEKSGAARLDRIHGICLKATGEAFWNLFVAGAGHLIAAARGTRLLWRPFDAPLRQSSLLHAGFVPLQPS